MKIGIYTFTAANNYGAVLQAYALKEFLCKNGYEAYCIDYRPKFLTERYTPFSKANMRRKNGPLFVKVLKEIIRYPIQVRKNRLFENFRIKYLNFSPTNVKDFDYFIVGSDQVWNYNLTRGDVIFLGNIPYSKENVIAYAASMEIELAENVNSDFSKQLDNFCKIGVREKELKDIIDIKFRKNCEHVVDPTLLLTSTQWREISEPYKRFDNNYIFMYGFGFIEEDVDIVRKFACQLGLKLIVASSGVVITGGFTNDISPNQFLYLIDHAKYIVTNSFHGTVFSVIFGKRILEIPHRNLSKNTRVNGLLRMIDDSFMPHNLYEGLDIDCFKQYQYDSMLLQKTITNSKNFLFKSLSVIPV